MIRSSSQRCLTLISELLDNDFSIQEKDPHKKVIAPAGLLDQTFLTLSIRANEKKIKLISRAADVPTVLADNDKIIRVLENLRISVHDNGIGIPTEMKPMLFEPFSNTVRRKGTAGEPSYGLGLYICRQIIEAHSGRIWFESEPDAGKTFYFLLPLIN